MVVLMVVDETRETRFDCGNDECQPREALNYFPRAAALISVTRCVKQSVD